MPGPSTLHVWGAPSSALIFQRPLTFFLGRPCRPCSRKLIYLRMNGKYCWSGTRQAGTAYRAEVVSSLSLSSWTVVFDKAASCLLHCGGCSPSAFSSVWMLPTARAGQLSEVPCSQTIFIFSGSFIPKASSPVFGRRFWPSFGPSGISE